MKLSVTIFQLVKRICFIFFVKLILFIIKLLFTTTAKLKDNFYINFFDDNLCCIEIFKCLIIHNI